MKYKILGILFFLGALYLMAFSIGNMMEDMWFHVKVMTIIILVFSLIYIGICFFIKDIQ